jgi:hypothetical protein
MDLVSDALAHDRTFRVLTIIDECTRECVAMAADTSLPGLRVILVLQSLAESRWLPQDIYIDNVLPTEIFRWRHAVIVGTARNAVWGREIFEC